ncbi:MAG: 5-(carboxyamino)imidazole ribonucleotide mutase [Candidatus Heimdallarchaeota archaeon]|nr:MAG: 5-(carboxyamino)imidazole ribonucleotide mutase [Candidatus Gerdarchaeota archaeon]RLI73590.1 MAG: 5-(carboxyamino)imidazole ribonucleotide mutase [Candidatus Heimdallarchaeota archaeon]
MTEPVVAIISGSKSDNEIVEKVVAILKEFEVPHTAVVLSAHRNAKELDDYLSKTPAKVIIAIAGLAAALPGVCASKTKRVVIGVPVSAKLGGLDALLSIVQMPSGIPVATVGIDNGKNAAHLAIRILALNNDDLGKRLRVKLEMK